MQTTPSTRSRRRFLSGAALALLAAGRARAAPAAAGLPAGAECIVPAKEGGGFDLTCKAAKQLMDGAGLLNEPLRIRYVPGGIGAIVFKKTVANALDDPGQLIAFSGGSLLNIAQKRFGPYTEADVKWVASLAMDHGIVAVREDSPIRSFTELVAAVRARPSEIVFGAGGTIGSQDWVKAAEIARAAQRDFRLLRYVAFEGGGDAMKALERGYVHVVSGDAAELNLLVRQGARVRVLAAFSQERLPGVLASVPTATEQGFDIIWPVVRGFYLGPRVSTAHYDAWTSVFRKAVTSPGYRELIHDAGMRPFFLAGDDLTDYVVKQVHTYREIARRYKLV